jgi:hypothetical protein
MRVQSRRGAERLAVFSNTVAEGGAMVTPDDEATEQELRQALHEEVGRLPAPLRAAVVVCYLEEVSQDRAAVLLRCPLGTLKHRLARARAMLEARLRRRGMIASSLLVMILLTEKAPAVPIELARSTASAASHLAARSRMSSHVKRLAGMTPAPLSTTSPLLPFLAGTLVLILATFGGVQVARGFRAVLGGDTSFEFLRFGPAKVASGSCGASSISPMGTPISHLPAPFSKKAAVTTKATATKTATDRMPTPASTDSQENTCPTPE